MAKLSAFASWAGFCLLTLTWTGCFHKDVMTDRADDVVNAIVYAFDGDTLIITKEEIFQASSKESNGGVTHISGHSEMRLSSYDPRTGDLIGRVELGDMIDEANALVGITPGKVWMFSINDELGLHYRDPKTLEVVKTWTQISETAGGSRIQAAKPDWPVINQFYGLDYQTDQVALTDGSGYIYLMNPETFKAQKVDLELRELEPEDDCLSTSGEIKLGMYISLTGSPRAKISYANKETGPEQSFLEGKIVLDMDPIAAAKRRLHHLDSLRRDVQFWRDSLAKRPDDYQTKYQFENAERELKQADSWSRPIPQNPLLGADGKSIYIFHASAISDTAHAQFSRVNLNPDSTWTIAWTTFMPNLYFDYSKADQAGAFEKVYSKGNPEFDYQWIGRAGNIMVVIMQLRMVGIDMSTGKIIWDKEL